MEFASPFPHEDGKQPFSSLNIWTLGTFFFWELHSTTQTLTTRTHTNPYEYTYVNPTPMSTSEGLSTDRSGDSRSHQWRLIVDGNAAYHLTHNAGKSWKIQEKVRAPGFEPWWVASHWTVLPLDYKPNRLNTWNLNNQFLKVTEPSGSLKSCIFEINPRNKIWNNPMNRSRVWLKILDLRRIWKSPSFDC
jgi:hypothetical protein